MKTIIFSLMPYLIYAQALFFFFDKQPQYNQDAEALFDRLITKPSLTEKQSISNTCDCLNEATGTTNLNQWADVIYGFAGETQEISGLNWVKDAHNITEVNTPVWTQYQGYTGNASTIYLNTNYSDSLNGLNLTRTSASMMIYSRTNSASVYRDAGRTQSGSINFEIVMKWTDNKAYGNALSDVLIIGAMTTSDGFHIVTRTSSTKIEGYKNGVSFFTNNAAATGKRSINNITIMARNDGATRSGFSNRQYSFFILSRGVSDEEAMAITNCIENNYMDSAPRETGVIP